MEYPRRPLMTLTKDDVVKALVKETGCQLNQSVEMIETLLELIKFTLASGEDLLISGFGKFCVNEKRQRKGRNPATGEDMMLAARRVVTFRCSRQLKKKINNEQE
jgi:integration host factor subunit alpha